MEINVKIARSENFAPATRKLSDIAYIVVHYTGNKGDTAKNNADYFAREIIKPSASAHFFVDENAVWQSVPDNHAAWHVGASKYYHPQCRNANSLGVEICMLDKNGQVRQGSIDRAAELVRELMLKYSIPDDHVIRHYDVTHKDCPAPMVTNPARWQAFKDAIQEEDMTQDKFNQMFKTAMVEYRKSLQDNDAGGWSADARQWAIDNGLFAGSGTAPDGHPNFMWEDLLTREQAATLFYRFAQQHGMA